MGNVLDILVLIQSIARVCVLFDFSVPLSEPVYRVITIIICCIRIAAYFKKHGKRRPSKKDVQTKNHR